MKCLVTGGAGFIGSNLSRALFKKGMHVIIVDNFSNGKKNTMKDIMDDVEIYEADIRNIELLTKAMKGVTYVFHQAALPSVKRSIENPLATNDANIGGSLNVLSAALHSGVKRVVFASSSSVYGDTPVLPKQEQMPPNPKSPYALSKYTGEVYCRLFWELYQLETISLRYFNVFGPHQDPDSPYAAVIANFVSRMLRNEAPMINGDGKQTRDFCYVDNVVQANLLSMECKQADGIAMNIGCGGRINLLELVDLLNEYLGTNLSPVFLSARPGDIQDSLASIEIARNILGYQPTVSVKEGLYRFVTWMKNQQNKN